MAKLRTCCQPVKTPSNAAIRRALKYVWTWKNGNLLDVCFNSLCGSTSQDDLRTDRVS